MRESRAPQTDPPLLLIVMGVSGCGKSHVGRRLAEHLDCAFLEGDTLHPEANIARMRAGVPLDDADRRPWLDAIGAWLDARQARHEAAVITCSALKRCYRDRLRQGRPGVCFAWLKVDRTELQRRLHARSAHFMPPSLLDSQLAALQVPAADEPVVTVDANRDINHTVRLTLDLLQRP